MKSFVEIKRTRVVHLGVDIFEVSIARPSKWGNPFKIGEDGTRDQVIEMYRQYLLGRPDLLAAIPIELKGKVLGCYCKPERCHGDVLAEIADGVPPEEAKRAAPTEQALLPGYKKYVRSAPKDFRAWRDGRGQQIDAPTKRGGGSFGGKVIAPLTDRSGKPIRLGDFPGRARLEEPIQSHRLVEAGDGSSRRRREKRVRGGCCCAPHVRDHGQRDLQVEERAARHPRDDRASS